MSFPSRRFTGKAKSGGAIGYRILAAKQREAKADVSALDREIDRLVYELYDLTNDEIAIVEGSTRR